MWVVSNVQLVSGQLFTSHKYHNNTLHTSSNMFFTHLYHHYFPSHCSAIDFIYYVKNSKNVLFPFPSLCSVTLFDSGVPLRTQKRDRIENRQLSHYKDEGLYSTVTYTEMYVFTFTLLSTLCLPNSWSSQQISSWQV